MNQNNGADPRHERLVAFLREYCSSKRGFDPGFLGEFAEGILRCVGPGAVADERQRFIDEAATRNMARAFTLPTDDEGALKAAQAYEHAEALWAERERRRGSK